VSGIRPPSALWASASQKDAYRRLRHFQDVVMGLNCTPL
jgi:hypothetical protein